MRLLDALDQGLAHELKLFVKTSSSSNEPRYIPMREFILTRCLSAITSCISVIVLSSSIYSNAGSKSRCGMAEIGIS